MELEEFVGSLCNNLEVQDLRGYFQADQTHLDWYTSYYDGPHIGPRYDGYDVDYRIERLPDQKGEGAQVWYWVAAVTNDNGWAGPADPGQWIYRVAVSSITKNGQPLSCQGGLRWSQIALGVPAPLTPDEFAEFAGSLCDQLVVHDLNAHLQEDTLQLNWYTSYYDSAYVGPRYDNYDVGYRVERRPDQPDSDTAIWHFVAHVNRDRSWEGSAEPGRWIYRVAVSSITEEGQTFQCHGNQRWQEVGVKVPTEEELAVAAAQREILHAEVTRCAKEGLVNNISDEALPIITSYIERTVAEQVAHINDNDELAELTVTMCAQGNGADGGANAANLWLLLLLLDLGL